MSETIDITRFKGFILTGQNITSTSLATALLKLNGRTGLGFRYNAETITMDETKSCWSTSVRDMFEKNNFTNTGEITNGLTVA